ncbi:PhnD/SsuA/transferrin family substrate-binding protein [Phenylobacterium sp. LjRoot219]|uniref:phosphate/phosphite/phosphonate ABC transporter substrate-binding protein n=1 Tax=Phenylobacterium sp. LjRoot219 TaxID=3342283 RepID=UPI003ECFB112
MNAWSPVPPTCHAATALAPIAALQMYDGPQLQAANDALWRAVAERLTAEGVADVPAQLTRAPDLAATWSSPALLLAQTCGYPLIKGLGDRVQLVATPRYRAPGCEGPFRRSAVVVRAHDPADRLAELRGARCAVNDAMSDSGMNLLRAAVAPLADGRAFFQEVVITGSHLASAEAVAGGDADVAALDAVSYAHLRRFRPELAWRLRRLAWTERTPGLPLITAATTPAATLAALRRALAGVAADPRFAEVRETLLLDGFSPLPLHYYRLTAHREERAQALGYPTLQ